MLKINKIIICIFLLINISIFAKDSYTVGFAQDTMGNDWRVAQVKGVEDGFKKIDNIKFFYTNAKANTAIQIINIEDMIEQGVDLIISSPRDAKAMAPVVEKAYDKGIPVVLLSRTISSDKYTTFIHPKNYLIAKQAAKFIAKKIDNKGTVVMLQGVPTASTVVARTNGFMDEISNHKNIKVIKKAANYLRNDAVFVIEKLISEGIKFDAIYAQSDSMAIGAIMALKKNNIDPKNIVITGIDYINESRDLILEGELDASYVYPTGAKEGVEAAVKILAGKKVDKEIIIESTEVTIENVDRVKPIF